MLSHDDRKELIYHILATEREASKVAAALRCGTSLTDMSGKGKAKQITSFARDRSGFSKEILKKKLRHGRQVNNHETEKRLAKKQKRKGLDARGN